MSQHACSELDNHSVDPRAICLSFYNMRLWVAVFLMIPSAGGRRLVSLSPLMGVGVLRVGGVGGSTEMPAAYLARETGVEITEDNEDGITLFDVVPLLMEKEATTSWVDRDGGLYDNIPYPVLFPSNPLAKKELRESVKEAQNRASPASAFLASLRERNLFVCGLLVEVASQLTPTSLTLGAAVLLARTEAQDCLLSEEDALEINNTTIIVACRRDELLQIAECSPKLRIKMASSLFRKVSLDAVLRENKLIASTREESNSMDRENVPPAWEILDAERFLSMGIYEKRAVLRASGGATKVPRPREGEEALDRALESFMDASVRELVVSQRLHRPSGTSPTSSVRAALLHDIAKAINDGDMSKAHILGNDFARATRLLADPTQDSDSYDKHLDQDEWYERNRRRSMGGK